MPIKIAFCGTGIHSEHQRSALVQAAKAVKAAQENILVLSGVGAKTKRLGDQDGSQVISTPGVSFWKPWRKESVLSGSLGVGEIYGSGEQANINRALEHITEKLQNATCDEDKIIDVAGYSRGAKSAIRLANEIYIRYGTSVKVNLYLEDPCAGPFRTSSLRKTSLPPNVNHVYFTFSRDNVNAPVRHPINTQYRSRGLDQYQFLGDATHVSAIALPGTHGAQDVRKKYLTDHSAHETNLYFLKKFFGVAKCGDKPKQPNKTDLTVTHSFYTVASPEKSDPGLHTDFVNYHATNGDSQTINRASNSALKNFITALNDLGQTPYEVSLRRYGYDLACSLAREKEDQRITDVATAAIALIKSSKDFRQDGSLPSEKFYENLTALKRTSRYCSPATRSSASRFAVVVASPILLTIAVTCAVASCVASMAAGVKDRNLSNIMMSPVKSLYIGCLVMRGLSGRLRNGVGYDKQSRAMNHMLKISSQQVSQEARKRLLTDFVPSGEETDHWASYFFN